MASATEVRKWFKDGSMPAPSYEGRIPEPLLRPEYERQPARFAVKLWQRDWIVTDNLGQYRDYFCGINLGLAEAVCDAWNARKDLKEVEDGTE
jgi:hypothetical protein